MVMSDNNVATKEDIQLLIEAMHSFGEKIDSKLDKKIDGLRDEMNEKFDDLKEEIEERFDDAHHQTAILIEDSEDRILGGKKDEVSVHSDKLKVHDNQLGKHEKRIDIIESKVAFA